MLYIGFKIKFFIKIFLFIIKFDSWHYLWNTRYFLQITTSRIFVNSNPFELIFDHFLHILGDNFNHKWVFSSAQELKAYQQSLVAWSRWPNYIIKTKNYEAGRLQISIKPYSFLGMPKSYSLIIRNWQWQSRYRCFQRMGRRKHPTVSFF